MKRLLAAIVILASLTACMALPPDGGPSRSLYIIDFIVANSDYEYNGEPLPDVVRDNELTYLYGGSDIILGTYYTPNNTVYLIDSADFGVEIHEYVHYLQMLSGEWVHGVTCPGLVEPAAHKVEDTWLDLIDSDAPRSDPLWLAVMYSGCFGRFSLDDGH